MTFQDKYLLPFRELVLKVKRKIYYRQNIYSRDLSTSNNFKVAQLKGDFSVVKIDKSCKDLLVKYANENRAKNHFEKNLKLRLGKNKRFIGFAAVCQQKNEIAYLCWLDLEMIELNDAKFTMNLNANQAYFFDDHCLPEYRRLGLHKKVFEDRLNYCINHGIQEVLIAIMNDNKRAINNLYKFNFKLIKTIYVYPFINFLDKIFMIM
ncbi:MAG: GNAT family N-acetyltransferase [Flavobacteriaceae bacterium]